MYLFASPSYYSQHEVALITDGLRLDVSERVVGGLDTYKVSVVPYGGLAKACGSPA